MMRLPVLFQCARKNGSGRIVAEKWSVSPVKEIWSHHTRRQPMGRRSA
jgi:hypothetical protein